MTDSQRRLGHAIAEVAEIDDIITQIRAREDRDNERRRQLGVRRRELERQVGELFTRAHHPEVAVVVGGRVLMRDIHLGLMTLPIVTVSQLEALADPAPNGQPEPSPGVESSHCVTLGPPEFTKEDA